MKILLIEDNQRIGEAIKEGLTDEGFNVTVINNGLDAYNHLVNNQELYDLILLDLMLPGKSGMEICRDLRVNKFSKPLLMLTALDAVDDRVQGLNNGADDYLPKPFNFDELVARIKALLRRPQEFKSEIIEYGPLTLNKSTMQLYADNQLLPITLKEYKVMEYLITNSNQALSRDQILDYISDHAIENFSNVVDVHIKNLRKKLGNYGKNLETIRGLGYKLSF